MTHTMNLPNFLVIGAQKCGTTWMHTVMEQHPDIFVPKQKELEYFSYKNKPKRMGSGGYAEFFRDVGTETAIGEKTPSYLWNSDRYNEWDNKPGGFQKDIPGAVYELLGKDIKLLVCLRNPLDRAISGYLHHIHRGTADRYKSILDEGKYKGIIHLGFYYEHISIWLEKYPITQMLILIFEELMSDKSKGCSDIFRFLGVDEDFRPEGFDAVVHEGIMRWSRDGNIYILKEGSDKRGKQFDLEELQLVVTADEIAEISGYYEKDIDNLELLLGRSLEIWR